MKAINLRLKVCDERDVGWNISGGENGSKPFTNDEQI